MPQPQFLNSAKTFVADALRGALTSADDLVWHSEPGYLTRGKPLPPGQVALLSGGGSGHEPLHAGFVGAGMLTGACPGLVFTSPNALQIAAATRAVDAGAGVVHIVKNYTGDVLNFRIGSNLAAESGVTVSQVLVADDVATESDEGPGRRGTAAVIAVEKICGAAAERGDDLATVTMLGQRVADNARTMAVALRACTLPGASSPSFDLADHEIEIGIGIHGERGVDRIAALPANELVRRLADPVIASLSLDADEEVFVIVNGLGGTHPLQLQLLFAELVDYLATRSIVVRRTIVGSFVTALNMEGASVTLVRCDEEIVQLWDAPTAAPGWPNAPSTEAAQVPASSDVVFRAPIAADRGDSEASTEPDCLDRAAVGSWLGNFVEKVVAAEPELTDLDRQAGDGDFGTNMVAALDHVDISGVRDTFTLPTAFRTISDAYLGHAGGTSGALFGIWFREFYRAAEKGLTVATIAAAARQGLDTIAELGNARTGDKTMIDAIAPAVDALEHAVADGSDLAAGLSAAADAAGRGARSTTDLVAKRGRASYVGAAARGVIDPGALVISWFFAEAAAAVDRLDLRLT
ncbi:dihydroxyacetone kinase family protein [Antrihabitans stalagmiti]